MTDHQQAAIEAVKAELDSQEAMHCTRVWEAWRYGTMTEEDFVNVSEDDECVQALVSAAEPHLRKKWAEGVVCLCGSTRFRAEIVEANRLLTLEGHIVLAPGVFGHDGDPITDDEKAKLDALHLRKIDMAEQVIVIAPGGYIGESTRREIVYAESTGKPVIIWNRITLEGAEE